MPFLKLLFSPENAIQPETHETLTGFYKLKNEFMTALANFTKSDPHQALMYVCILIIIAIFLKNATLYISRRFLIPYRIYSVRDIRNEFYKKILRLPMSHFTDEKKGDLMSRISNDVTEVEASLNSSLDSVFKDPFSIVLSLILLVFISPQLTLIVFIALPFAALITSAIGKKIKSQSLRTQEKQAELMSNVEETIGGIRIIKAFNNASYFHRKFIKQNNLLSQISVAINLRRDISSPLSETLSIIILVIILSIGGNMVLNGSSAFSADSFIFYIVVFSQIIPPAKGLSNSFYNILKGVAAKNRIDEIINTDEKITESKNPKSLENFEEKIEFKNVNFKYEDKWVLQDINLEIKKGELVALVGPSGGGKSTLADLLPRFYDPNSGEITIDGIQIKELKIADLRKQFGVVTQESILFNDSVFNNISFGNYSVTQAEIEAAAMVANAHEFIVNLDKKYQTNIGERGNKLSGGQRQRIAIARAVLRNPDILILDEATSALDNASERLVQDALEKLMKGRTSVVIAHRLSTIQHADKIVVLQHGKIIQVGKHLELLSQNGLYKELYEMQQFVS